MVYRNGLWWYKGNAFGTLRNALISAWPDDWTGPGETPAHQKSASSFSIAQGAGECNRRSLHE